MEVKLEVSTFVVSPKLTITGAIQNSQQIEFMYDEYIKGKSVAIKLTSNDGRGIHAPNLEIYLNNTNLKKILEFLIESEK